MFWQTRDSDVNVMQGLTSTQDAILLYSGIKLSELGPELWPADTITVGAFE